MVLILLLPLVVLAGDQADHITIGPQTISIHYADNFTATERHMIHRWLQEVADCMLTIYGALPEDHFRVHVARSEDDTQPVPWGEVERDNVTTVVLQVRPEFGYEKLLADWTAFHEFSHLLLPYQGYDDIWFSEGVATYYQNITMARSGSLDERDMWQRIADGLARGSGHTANLTLGDINLRNHEHSMVQRVYWSGVLYWLNADVALRQQGKGSLDQALHKLKDCCQTHIMTAAQLAWKLDDLMDTELFLPLFHQYRQSRAMPDYASLLQSLGIQIKADGLVVLADGSLSNIRRHIYKPLTGTQRASLPNNNDDNSDSTGE